MKRMIAALSGAGLIVAAIAVGSVGAATVASSAAGATTTCATASGAAPCIAITPTTPLAVNHESTITVKGANWGYTVSGTKKTGDTVYVSICNTNTVLDNPLVDLGSGGPSAVQACVPDFVEVKAVGTTATTLGTFTTTLHFYPGQQGNQALSECPVTATEAAFGVECVIGAADVTETTQSTSTAGAQADAPLFFAPPAVDAVSDTYGSGSGTAATYAATIGSAGTFQPSEYAPTSESYTNGTNFPQTIPNNGGWATQGLVIEGAPTSPSPTAPSCATSPTEGCLPAGDAYVSGVLFDGTTSAPASCQAGTTAGDLAWGASTGSLTCTYGYAIGEPIALFLKTYVAPVSATDPTTTNPLAAAATGVTVTAANFDAFAATNILDACGVDGNPTAAPVCEDGLTLSAGAGATTTNPGGFTADSSNVALLGDLLAGRYVFQTLGTASYATATGTVVLGLGPCPTPAVTSGAPSGCPGSTVAG